MTTQESQETWGIVDLFGHTKLAGRLSNHAFGGDTFLRVDIPNENGSGFYTRLFGKGAIYSISFTDETIARAAAKRCSPEPISAYELKRLLPEPQDPSLQLPDDFVPEDGDEFFSEVQ